MSGRYETFPSEKRLVAARKEYREALNAILDEAEFTLRIVDYPIIATEIQRLSNMQNDLTQWVIKACGRLADPVELEARRPGQTPPLGAKREFADE